MLQVHHFTLDLIRNHVNESQLRYNALVVQYTQLNLNYRYLPQHTQHEQMISVLP